MSVTYSNNIEVSAADTNAINLEAANLDVIIGQNVHITANGSGDSSGIASNFSGETLTISTGAEITGTAYGVSLSGGGSAVTNAGLIKGFNGIKLGTPIGTATQLANKGVIETVIGTGNAIEMCYGSIKNQGTIKGFIYLNYGLDTGGTAFEFENSGTLIAGDSLDCLSVSGAYLSLNLTNTGSINGNINLGVSSFYGDIYDGRNGKITGTVDLGGGNDKAFGNASYDETFLGGQGDDTIDGGGGNDIALYSGPLARYDISTVDGVTTIVAKVGDEGTDTLTNVRFAKFAGDNQTVVLYNSAPAGLALSASAVAENTPTGTPVATVSATDADGDALTYALTDPTGTFTLDGTSLVLLKALDYETGPHAYELTLTATDAYGLARSEKLSFAVTDVADTPAIGGGGAGGSSGSGGGGSSGGSGGSGSPSGPVALTLIGTARVDRLTGADGNDVIKGLAGNDVLKGLGGHDKLYGGAGKDVLYGGAGQDIFVFDAKFNKKTNLDKIADFNVKDDTLWLENSLFKANKTLYAAVKKGSEAKPLKMASKFFTVGDKAKDGDDFFVYDKKKGVLYYDADGSGSKAAVELATLKKGLKITDKDFFFV